MDAVEIENLRVRRIPDENESGLIRLQETTERRCKIRVTRLNVKRTMKLTRMTKRNEIRSSAQLVQR
jgi:hypothetical protein